MDEKNTKNKDLGAFASVCDDCLQHGLTKREYFASKAMAAMIANPNIKRPNQDEDLDKDLKNFCSIAVEYADGLLSALSESN